MFTDHCYNLFFLILVCFFHLNIHVLSYFFGWEDSEGIPSSPSINWKGSFLLLFLQLKIWLVAKMIQWCCRGVVVITAAQLHSTKPLLRFCTGSKQLVRDWRWWVSLTMVPAENMAKRVSPVDHTTKAIHHHHHHHHHHHITVLGHVHRFRLMSLLLLILKTVMYNLRAGF